MWKCGLFKGRCAWVNMGVKQSEHLNEEEENEELEEDVEESEPEVGPPLLTPLSEDAGSLPLLVILG